MMDPNQNAFGNSEGHIRSLVAGFAVSPPEHAVFALKYFLDNFFAEVPHLRDLSYGIMLFKGNGVLSLRLWRFTWRIIEAHTSLLNATPKHVYSLDSRPMKSRVGTITRRNSASANPEESHSHLTEEQGFTGFVRSFGPMSQIDFRLLQSAIVLADELNFSRAASRLHLTQPGLTKQIQDLESQLGVIIFERSSQGVELTEPGRVFIEHAKLAVFHLERAVHLTRAAAKGAEVVVNFGSSPYIDPYIVSTILSVRLSLFPTMHVHTHSHFSHELMRQVSSGELDIAIVAAGEENSRLNFLELERHPLFALMKTEDAAARKRAACLGDFDDRVWVLFGIRAHAMRPS